MTNFKESFIAQFCKIGFFFFTIFNDWYIEVKIAAKYLYTHHPFITLVADKFSYGLNLFFSSLNNYYIEPYRNEWICLTFINENFKKYYIHETYDYYHSGYDEGELTNLMALNYATLEDRNENKIFIMKHNNNYISKCNFNKNIQECLSLLNYKKGKSCFAQISYTHPDMEYSIDLNLDDSYFLDGNELLSEVFVLKQLYYQTSYFIFSENYVISIIDKDINTIELHSNQYIKIKVNDEGTQASYKIIS